MPTFSNTADTLKEVVELLARGKVFATSEFLPARNEIRAKAQTSEGIFTESINNETLRYRTTLNTLINPGRSASMIAPVLRTFGEALDLDTTGNQGIIDHIYDHMHENSLSIKSRNLTFGALTTGGSNNGDGTLHRLTVNKDNYEIQNTWMDDKRIDCIQDLNSGSRSGEEIFEIKAGFSGVDSIEREGSGLSGTMTAVTYSSSTDLITNPSFNLFGGEDPDNPTSINQWEVNGNIANFELKSNNIYRDFPQTIDTGSAYSLNFKTNDKITQDLTLRRRDFSREDPYYLQIAYYPETGSDGTLKLTLGNVDVSADLSDVGTHDQWNILSLPLGTNNWFDNFNKETLTVEIEVTGMTSGSVLVDDLILTPFINFDNIWYIIVGGRTPFLIEDFFEYTGDSSGNEGLIQIEFWKGFNRTLPHSGTPTISDPTLS